MFTQLYYCVLLGYSFTTVLHELVFSFENICNYNTLYIN